MSSIEGKVAIVTGAASGIGKEIARELARAGAAVAIADLNVDGANAVAAEIEPAGGARDGHRDGRHRRGRGRMPASPRWSRRFGGVDILVSNAGIQIVNPIENYAYADWKKMLAIHLDGAFLTTKAVLPHMYRTGPARPRRRGHLHGLGALAPGLAAEVGLRHRQARAARAGAGAGQGGRQHGVRANVMCPGFVRTPLVDKQIPEQAKELGISEDDVVKKVMLGKTVDGEFTTVEDVAQTVRFLVEFPQQRADRAELHRQPRLAHAVAVEDTPAKFASTTYWPATRVQRLRPRRQPGVTKSEYQAWPRRMAAPKQHAPQNVALVLQGGGALGAYQAGVYQGLPKRASRRTGSPACRSARSTPR